MSEAAIQLRPLVVEDWPAVEATYAAGIATGNATFQTQPPSWTEFDEHKLQDHRWVAVDHDEILGWAAAAAVSDRRVYAGVAEHSVYVAPDRFGRGIGTHLVRTLVASTEAAAIWTLIFPENFASLTLHERCGFRIVGTRGRIGRHFGRWRDVVMVERRSRTVG